MRALLTLSLLASAVSLSAPALAQTDGVSLTIPPPQQQPVAVPAPRGNGTLANAMAYVRTGRWDAARAEIDAMRDARLAAFARAELYLAANSPHVAGEALRELLTQAPDLQQAQRLAGWRSVAA